MMMMMMARLHDASSSDWDCVYSESESLVFTDELSYHKWLKTSVISASGLWSFIMHCCYVCVVMNAMIFNLYCHSSYVVSPHTTDVTAESPVHRCTFYCVQLRLLVEYRPYNTVAVDRQQALMPAVADEFSCVIIGLEDC